MLNKAFQSEGVATILITPKSLSLQRLDQFKLFSINKDESYLLGWKYILLLKIGNEVYKRAATLSLSKHRKELKEKIKYIRRFLILNNQVESKFLEKLWGPASYLHKLISKFTIKAYGVEGSVEVPQAGSKILPDNELDKLLARIESIHSELDDMRIVVLIDKVDEMWNDSEESKMIIIGLIKAVHELNIALRRTRTLLFLRSNIYDILKFSDADKYHTLEERLDWSEDDLKYLIATRGKVSASLPMNEPNALWNSIFEFRVLNEPSFEYIVKRTMRRPRELIQFCNNARAVAQDKRHEQIYKEDILDAEKQYSLWKLKDLVSEFLVQYPHLEDVLGMFEGFKAAFKLEELNSRLQSNKEKLTRKYPALQSVSNDRIIQDLFTIGFLGTRKSNKDIFMYDEPKTILAQQEILLIHPAFHSAMGI